MPAHRALLAALGISVVLGACKSTCASGSDVSSGPPTPTALVPKAPVHFVGRFYGRDAAGATFTYPSTELRARFTGGSLIAKLSDPEGQNRFSVIVDGHAPTLLQPNPVQREYTVASGLTPGEHDIAIIRRTETWFGPTRFDGFVTEPGSRLIETPAPYARTIEIVGDSISCGFGVHGPDASCAFSPETEDSTASYGALTAVAFHAAHVDLCWSGRGMLRNSDGSTTDTMPELYEREWEAPRYAADVVVVNLGTNDYFAGSDPGAPFEATYVAFLKKVRAAHPGAFVICGIGTMLTGAEATAARAHVERVVRTMNERGDAKVAFVEFQPQDLADGVGCRNHPNEKTQRKMADVLTAKVKALTGW